MLPFPFQFGGLGMTLPQSAGGDPNFSNVSLLLHCDGTNGSTTFTDSSSSPKTVTSVGGAEISTAQSKFGGSSGLFDGVNNYLSVPASTAFDFASGDFTIEMFAYLNNTPNGSALISETFTGGGDSVQFTIGFCNGTAGSTSGSRPFFGNFNATSWAGAISASSLTLNTWLHIAAVRYGTTWTLYVDGSSVASATISRTLASDDAILIGRRWDTGSTASYFDGYIDELRITKGVARYTADFTPPIAPFPNS